jgi:hypothetical protein
MKTAVTGLMMLCVVAMLATAAAAMTDSELMADLVANSPYQGSWLVTKSINNVAYQATFTLTFTQAGKKVKAKIDNFSWVVMPPNPYNASENGEVRWLAVKKQKVSFDTPSDFGVSVELVRLDDGVLRGEATPFDGRRGHVIVQFTLTPATKVSAEKQ